MPDPKLVRVVLADDHRVVSAALARLIEEDPNLELVALAVDGQSALRAVREHRPDVALIDLDMPAPSGLDVLRTIIAEGLPTRVLILTGSVEERMVLAAVNSGAAGYLLKTADQSDYLKAVLAVASGHTIIDPKMAGVLASAMQHAHTELNAREQRVLILTAEGKTAKEIGDKIGLGDRMVRKHLTRVYAKLGVTSKSQALLEAKRRGLVP